jgi:hypothetical protein
VGNKEAQPGTGSTAAPVKRERRTQPRHAVDTSVAVYFVYSGCRMQGRIVDLSLGGCCIRSLEPFPVGTHTRVEIEFCLNGLPFRLAGVSQTVHDRHQVGIRLLDVSSRKREQLNELIAEIAEMQGTGIREQGSESAQAGS